MDRASAVILALGTLLSGTLTAWALVKKAGAPMDRGRSLLCRLYDWISWAGYRQQLPTALRDDVEEFLNDNSLSDPVTEPPSLPKGTTL